MKNIYYVIINFNTFLAKIQEVPKVPDSPKPNVVQNGESNEDVLMANRLRLAQKMSGPKKKADKQ